MAPDISANARPLVYAVLGALIVHHGILIHGEWHLHVGSILAAHAVGAGSLWAIVNSEAGHGFFAGGAFTAICIGYLVTLYTSMIIYRLFFHKLRQFPGPKMAAATKFWHIWHSRTGQNHLVMERLHKKYGTVVRSGPNEVSVFHPSAIELLDGPSSKLTRDSWYDLLKPRESAIFVRDEMHHKELRATWANALSSRALDEYGPRLLSLVDQLSDCIEAYNGKPVSVNDVMAWFAFDAMGEFTFSKDFNMMRSSDWHPVLWQQQRALDLLAPFNDAVWPIHVALSYFPFIHKVQSWKAMVAFCEGYMEKRIESGNDKPDLASAFINEYESLKGKVTEEQRDSLLNGNAISSIVAGSDTTRSAMISIWYHLCMHPKHIDILLDELANVDETDHKVLARLPHLNGVINEAMRLIPAQMTGGSRMTPPEGLKVGDHFIPGNVKIVAPKYVVQRLPEAFPRPLEFIPERWYSRPELVKDRRAYAPFTVGSRQCVGKNLALLELRIMTAILLRRFKVKFSKEHDPAKVLDDLKDTVTAQPGECMVIFERR